MFHALYFETVIAKKSVQICSQLYILPNNNVPARMNSILIAFARIMNSYGCCGDDEAGTGHL